VAVRELLDRPGRVRRDRPRASAATTQFPAKR
jgi:hypothetical protein